LKTISALKEAAVFTTELQECASRVKEIIRDAQTKSVVYSATATVSNVGTSDSVGTSNSPLVPRSLKYNNAIVHLDEMKTSPVKQDAFALNKKGDLRSLSASRKAKNRAVNTIVSAVQSVGNPDQQKLALRDAILHPRIQGFAQAAGFHGGAKKRKTEDFFSEQAKKMVSRARETGHKKGRTNDDKASFVEAIITAFAESPEDPDPLKKTNKPTEKERIEKLDIPYSTGRRLFKKARAKRLQLKSNTAKVKWSVRKKRKGFSKITATVQANLRQWILDHPHVINSPIAKDTLLVRNSEGIKERVSKLLLEIPIRELHNDLILPPREGGLADARDASGNVIISDTSLRRLLPKQLRVASESHKQLCGCEICLTARSHQLSLNAWRQRYVKKLKDNADIIEDDSLKRSALLRCQYYKDTVLPNGQNWHSNAKEALKEVQCPALPHTGHPKWACVLGRCQECPKYCIPLEERKYSENDDASMKFHHYVNFTRCTKHGLLTRGAKNCEQCDNQTESTTNKKQGKISTRKQLTLLERPIGVFLRDFYLPSIEKLAYHLPHVIILSKNHCGAMRRLIFEKFVRSIKTHRDYAERLLAIFDLEIQSSHFGNGRSLSMEGSSVETYLKEEIDLYLSGEIPSTADMTRKLEFHSHFSDCSRQDCSTTHEHMSVLFKNLMEKGVLRRGWTVYDATDGCGKQYRSATTLFLLSLIATEFDLTMDRAIGAPGHGKDIVDGLNATDKMYLKKQMCMIGTPESNDSQKRMEAHSMTETASLSLAEECARLCSRRERAEGVKGDVKLKKREEKAKMKNRTYHVHKETDVRFSKLSMKRQGLDAGTHNGLLAHYHMRADPKLGLGKAALRRIPCGCDACLEQLAKEWKPNVPSRKQERYSTAENCVWSDMFVGGLNDWKIVTLTATDGCDSDEVDLANTVILENITTIMAENIEVGSIGAFQTEDDNADGYYLVQFTSEPYTLQEATLLTEYEPPLQLEEGELVCEATYFEKVPRARFWYTPTEMTTVLRVQQVVATKIELVEPSPTNPLPNTCKKRDAERLGARKITVSDHDDIIDESSRREQLDYEEDLLEDADEEGESLSSSSEDDSSLDEGEH
jgi:hypothetical protein